MAYRALILLWLALVGNAQAETIGATSQTTYYVTYDGVTVSGASMSAACAARTGSDAYGAWYLHWTSSLQCALSYASNPGVNNAYIQGWSTAAYVCPENQGWTLNGSTCTREDCDEGEIRNPSGVCESSCTALAGQPVSSGYYDMGTDPKKMSAVGCAPNGNGGGCLAVFSGTYPVKTAIVLGQVHYYAQGGYNYYDPAIHGSNPDTSCNPADPADKPAPSSAAAIPADQCAANQGYASMNGKTVCIDNATGEPTPATASQAAQSSSSTTSTTDGNGVTTTTTTTTTTTGDTITKTTVVQPNGDTTTTETGPQEEKPVYGQDDGAPAIGTLSHNFSIIPDANPFGAGGCPAPIPVLGNQLSFQTACDAFGTIRPLVIALGWLIAGFIFVGGLRNG